VAIYHLSVKAVSRSAGRSATAAAAYRAAVQILDERTGVMHDYTRKRGVLHSEIVLPAGAATWAADRSALWNAAEAAEKRKDACVARELVVAIPAELPKSEQIRLVRDFAQQMAENEGCAVDFNVHGPDTHKGADVRNQHAHLLRTTRKVGENALTDKLHTEKAGRDRKADLDVIRERWAKLCNERLAENGRAERIDHRSLQAQGIDRAPTTHLGPAVTEMERRGVRTEVRWRLEREASDRLAAAAERGQLERASQMLGRAIVDTETDLRAALAEREREKAMLQTVKGLERVMEQPAQIPDKILVQAEQRLSQYLDWRDLDVLMKAKLDALRDRVREERRQRELEKAARERDNLAARQLALRPVTMPEQALSEEDNADGKPIGKPAAPRL